MKKRLTTEQEILLFIPGSRWDDVRGTDYRLAMALAAHVPVLWVDPPLPFHRALRRGVRLGPRTVEITEVAPGITRVRSLSIPGFTRWGFASVGQVLLTCAIKTALRRQRLYPSAVVLSSPVSSFPAGVGGTRVLYVTDDWVAGAELMNLSRPLVERKLRDNLREADVCATVSPHLGAVIQETQDCPPGIVLIPNGCELPDFVDEGTERRRNAGLIGQLNERLDMELLEAVQEAGIPLLVIGPRAVHDPEMGRRLDAFLAAPNVTWLGELPSKELAPHLAEIGVGLTPYANTAFNRSSFPLKTLEYLAAGMPVVTSDLPAGRWLNTEFVAIGADPIEFASHVERILDNPEEAGIRHMRRDFAALHTWQVRADQLLGVIQGFKTETSSGSTRYSGISGR